MAQNNINAGNVNYTVSVTDKGGGLKKSVDTFERFANSIDKTTGKMQKITNTFTKTTDETKKGIKQTELFTQKVKDLGEIQTRLGRLTVGNPSAKKYEVAHQNMLIKLSKQRTAQEKKLVSEEAKAQKLLDKVSFNEQARDIKAKADEIEATRKANVKFWEEDKKARQKQIDDSNKRQAEYRKNIELINQEEKATKSLLSALKIRQHIENISKPKSNLSNLHEQLRAEEKSSKEAFKLTEQARTRQAVADLTRKNEGLANLHEQLRAEEKMSKKVRERQHAEALRMNKELDKVRSKSNKTAEKSYMRQLATLSKITFLFRSASRGLRGIMEMTKVAEGFEQKILSSNAVLGKFGKGIDNIVNSISEATGMGSLSIRGELAKTAGQLQGQGFDQNAIPDMLKRTGNIALGIAGSRGLSISKAYEQLENILAGEPQALDRAGFQFETNDLRGVSKQARTQKILERMEDYLSRTEASGVYLNNKTIMQQAESFKAVFETVFEKVYKKFGGFLGSPIGVAKNFFSGMFSDLSLENLNKSLNDLLVYLDALSKSQNLKKFGEILGLTVSFLISILPEMTKILALVGVVKIGQVITRVLAFFNGLPILTALFLKLKNIILPALWTAMSGFFTAIGTFLVGLSATAWLIIGGVAVAIGALVLLYKNWDKVKEWVVKISSKTVEVMTSVLQIVTDNIFAVFTSISDFVKGIVSKAKSLFGFGENDEGSGAYSPNPNRGLDGVSGAGASSSSPQTNHYYIQSSDPMGVRNEIEKFNSENNETTQIARTGRYRR